MLQLEDERKSINQVLEGYHQQCHLVLEELFKAQEERIKLCEQQMESIQNHHANICQELIDRLEANGQMRKTRKWAHSVLPGSQGLLDVLEKGRKKRRLSNITDHY